MYELIQAHLVLHTISTIALFATAALTALPPSPRNRKMLLPTQSATLIALPAAAPSGSPALQRRDTPVPARAA